VTGAGGDPARAGTARTRSWRAAAETLLALALAGAVSWGLASIGEVRNLALVFLPAVLYASVTWGVAAGSGAAVASLAAYNFFFLEPLNAFGLERGLGDLLTMAVFLAVAFITGSLAARARELARAAEAERFGSALLSSVSHDLRTPLATILGAATTLLSTAALDESRRAALARGIREEALRLDRFVANLLDMTRLRAGRLRPNLAPTEPGEVIGAALARLRGRLAGHELLIEVAADLPLAPLDPVLIDHVLQNLLDNAIRHTPEGRRIRLAAHSAEGGLAIVVEDEGSGVPAALREQLFGRTLAQSADTASSRAGLGLMICRGFVEAHAGTITVGESGFGGARFDIHLPAGP
jgi:two-component system, OmpR family, sensor histidine kinase KdpD